MEELPHKLELKLWQVPTHMEESGDEQSVSVVYNSCRISHVQENICIDHMLFITISKTTNI